MIFNLRGGNGTGKSYPGFELLKHYGSVDEIYVPTPSGKSQKLIGHVLPGSLVLAGRYTFGPKGGYSGGVDGYRPAEWIRHMIMDFSAHYDHVFFESMMISCSATPWWTEIAEHEPEEWMFALLDTPFPVALDGIYTRNGGKEVNVEALHGTYKNCWRSLEILQELGANTMMVPRERSYEVVRDTLMDAGWNPFAEQEEELQNEELQEQERREQERRVQETMHPLRWGHA